MPERPRIMPPPVVATNTSTEARKYPKTVLTKTPDAVASLYVVA